MTAKDLLDSQTAKESKPVANSLNDTHEKDSGKKHMPCKNSLPT